MNTRTRTIPVRHFRRIESEAAVIATQEIARFRDQLMPVTEKLTGEGGDAPASEMFDEIKKVRRDRRS